MYVHEHGLECLASMLSTNHFKYAQFNMIHAEPFS